MVELGHGVRGGRLAELSAEGCWTQSSNTVGAAQTPLGGKLIIQQMTGGISPVREIINYHRVWERQREGF